MFLETHMKLCMAELDFVKKSFFDLKIGKMDQKCTKTDFFKFIEKNGP